jgi:hypothetical protein
VAWVGKKRRVRTELTYVDGPLTTVHEPPILVSPKGAGSRVISNVVAVGSCRFQSRELRLPCEGLDWLGARLTAATTAPVIVTRSPSRLVC